MSKIQSNIMGLSEGLKSSEASDVKFHKPEKDPGINTLHIVYEGLPKSHNGMCIEAKQLGAPDPDIFESNFFKFFYQENRPHHWPYPWRMRHAQFVYSISVEDDERMKVLFPVIKRVIRRYDANLGGFEDSMMGVENTFRNMEMILRAPDISLAKNTYKAALLLSAGPSLDLEWAEIRRAQESGKFLIVGCDAIIKKALKEGVRPHIIMTTERVPGSEDFFRGISSDTLEGITLCSTLMAYRPTIEAWSGNKSFVVRQDYPSRWYPFLDRKQIWSAPSVAPTALGMIGLLGIKSVALVGQDLCLAKDGTSHAVMVESLEAQKKEMESQEQVRAESDNEWVETYSGEKRKTTNTWNVMKGDLLTTMGMWDQKVVSTAWHGSKIFGVPYQKLSEWIDGRLGGTPSGTFSVPKENPNFVWEFSKFKAKLASGIASLTSLGDNLDAFEPDDLIEQPHFAELCLTSCQRAYVTYLNKRFQRGVDKHEFKTLFRGDAYSAIKEAIDILKACQA